MLFGSFSASCGKYGNGLLYNIKTKFTKNADFWPHTSCSSWSGKLNEKLICIVANQDALLCLCFVSMQKLMSRKLSEVINPEKIDQKKENIVDKYFIALWKLAVLKSKTNSLVCFLYVF